MTFYVYSTDDFSGLFSSFGFKEGSIIIDLSSGDLVPERTRHSIEIDEDLHSEHTAGRFINHSFNPNCEVQGYLIVAIRDIAPDEELTFDYLRNESEISHPFTDRETGKLIAKNKPTKGTPGTGDGS